MQFTYDYEWVNQGEWRKESSEVAAITLAISAAFRAGVHGRVNEIYLVRQPCQDNHVDLCDHFRVTLTFQSY